MLSVMLALIADPHKFLDKTEDRKDYYGVHCR
jgi:hypothetical protein